MNNLDVAGLLTTYALKCSLVRSDKKLKEVVRELKRVLNSEEIGKLTVVKE
jgi:hypothetical protein